MLTGLALAAPLTVQQRLAKWKPVEMRFDAAAYSARERKMVDKLVEACRLLDDIYWRQSDLRGLALYKIHARRGFEAAAHDHGQPLGSAGREPAVRGRRSPCRRATSCIRTA